MPVEKQRKNEMCADTPSPPSPTKNKLKDILSSAFQEQSSTDTSPQLAVKETNANRGRPTARQQVDLQPSPRQQRARSKTTTTDDVQIQTMRPSQVASMLSTREEAPPLLIDLRSYDDYERTRIRHSINVNLPTLLVKRYKRGTVSNFNLESFIATEEGQKYYRHWYERPTSKKKTVIVYDENMQVQDEENDTSQAWILIRVLEKSSSCSLDVVGLDGGFRGFQAWDVWAIHLVGTEHPSTSSQLRVPGDNNNHGIWPKQSRSATTRPASAVECGSAKTVDNVQRRASLFSLDTNRAQRYQRRRKCRDENRNPSGSSGAPSSSTRPFDQQRLKNSSHESLAAISENSSAVSLNENSAVAEADDSTFTISEIVPRFLYLGPEISSLHQVEILRSRHIMRILNMAEECDDDVPGLKDSIKYNKVATRDIVEMQNIEETLRRAVKIIGKSKISEQITKGIDLNIEQMTQKTIMSPSMFTAKQANLDLSQLFWRTLFYLRSGL